MKAFEAVYSYYIESTVHFSCMEIHGYIHTYYHSARGVHINKEQMVVSTYVQMYYNTSISFIWKLVIFQAEGYIILCNILHTIIYIATYIHVYPQMTYYV